VLNKAQGCKGATAQRRKGVKAQGHKGARAQGRKGIMAQGQEKILTKFIERRVRERALLHFGCKVLQSGRFAPSCDLYSALS